MAVLRVLGGSTILENNIVQTGASAGSSIASGVIFTIPALVILGHWSDFQYLWVLAIAGLGGILGVFFSVPLRRALIVDQGLAFPEVQGPPLLTLHTRADCLAHGLAQHLTRGIGQALGHLVKGAQVHGAHVLGCVEIGHYALLV
jgi:putative OPT family oligopeptide transporter